MLVVLGANLLLDTIILIQSAIIIPTLYVYLVFSDLHPNSLHCNSDTDRSRRHLRGSSQEKVTHSNTGYQLLY